MTSYARPPTGVSFAEYAESYNPWDAMTVHDLRITRVANEVAAPHKQPHHPLGEFDTQALARRIVIFTPGGDQIESLVSLARRSIIGLTTTAEVACRVMSHNPDTVWGITR